MSKTNSNCDCSAVKSILSAQSKNVLSKKLEQCSSCETGKHSQEVRSRITQLLN
ncbi:MAG: hypothetical protein PHZ26_01665 [Candidatus Gracilibacteria bacterium]|nr:hypothetical protein [Candidatus Gracilibacteria bacterium]MDD2908441.1 hypothetical protein [Candidatus Gracilibacteria bacterium]